MTLNICLKYILILDISYGKIDIVNLQCSLTSETFCCSVGQYCPLVHPCYANEKYLEVAQNTTFSFTKGE
uniref:Uncharacterized protein n=1 Tax=Octopus bimaculoides TaxID=37653 RepID=A0A0L8GFD4_OCTBM